MILHNFDTFIERKICSEFNLDKAQIIPLERLVSRKKPLFGTGFQWFPLELWIRS